MKLYEMQIFETVVWIRLLWGLNRSDSRQQSTHVWHFHTEE